MTQETRTIGERPAEAQAARDVAVKEHGSGSDEGQAAWEALGAVQDERDAAQRAATQRGIESEKGNAFTHLEQYVIRAESEFAIDYLHHIECVTEEAKPVILEQSAADLAREPLKVKTLSGYYLENVVHDGGVRGGILERVIDGVIDVLTRLDTPR